MTEIGRQVGGDMWLELRERAEAARQRERERLLAAQVAAREAAIERAARGGIPKPPPPRRAPAAPVEEPAAHLLAHAARRCEEMGVSIHEVRDLVRHRDEVWPARDGRRFVRSRRRPDVVVITEPEPSRGDQWTVVTVVWWSPERHRSRAEGNPENWTR